MEKITIKGSDYFLPDEICVSCSRLSDPETFIVVTFALKGYRKNFKFPACQRCAGLHRRYRWRAAWLTPALMAPFIGAAVVFSYTDYYAHLTHTWGSLGIYLLSGVSLLYILSAYLLSVGAADTLALASLHDHDPPMKLVKITSIAPGYQWTFHFQNEDYAIRFLALNQVMLKAAA